MFAVKCVTKALELVLAFSVVAASAIFMFRGEWNHLNSLVLLFHIIINIYQRWENI